jgi:uncharacterized membrane protein
MDPSKDGPQKDSETLREKLERLHAELQRTESVDDETKGLLESLREDTRHLLEHEDEEFTERHATFNDRLSEAVAQFEGTHPELAYVMAKVIDTLSGLGI